MTDAYPERSQSPGGNHPRTSSMGGSGSVPTPANNVGGGTGWGDKGFFKGGSGTEGPGHANAINARSTIGEFLTLQQQKGFGERKFEKRAENMNVEDVDPARPSCETEDHSFMGHRPGCSQTLPGWSTAKDMVETTCVLSLFP